MKERWKQISEGDRLIVKPLYKYPVPTAHEVKILLDTFPDYSQIKVALGILIFQGLRPSELIGLSWHRFKFDEERTRITEMTHIVYKPSNRKTHTGSNYYFKELKKPMYSRWLSDQLIGYSKICANYERQRMFCWTKTDSLKTYFESLRKKAKNKQLPEEYNFLLDQNFEVVIGKNYLKYRISTYSLRRFSFTFHYYVTFKQDVVALARAFGHSRPETCLNHYIMPKEAIGLTQEMIDAKITMDEFVNSSIANQTVINDFQKAEIRPRFLERGQRTIFDYAFGH